MKIAVVVPVGPLDRYGYQHTWEACIGSYLAFADKVYCVSTRPGTPIPLVEMISNPETWFEDEFDVYQIVANMNLGLDKARIDGMDVVVSMDVNCYIPNGQAMREYCETVIEENRQYGWIYRKDQLGPVLFHVNGRRPRIFNLAHDWQVGMDCIERDGNVVNYQVAEFPEMDAVAYVDCGMEMTMDDFEAKMNYIRCYQDLLPKRSKVFDWGYWWAYYVAKFGKKKLDGPVINGWGRDIADKGDDEFVSWKLLEALYVSA